MAKFQLGPWFQAHRTPVLASAFGGAALLGLYARSKGQAATPSTGTGNAGASTDQTYQGTAGYYDSTANDVYNAMEPQIAALAAQLNALSQQQSAATTPPVTTPPTPTPPISAPHVPVGTIWGQTGGHVGEPVRPVTVPTHTGGSWGTTGPKA